MDWTRARGAHRSSRPSRVRAGVCLLVLACSFARLLVCPLWMFGPAGWPTDPTPTAPPQPTPTTNKQTNRLLDRGARRGGRGADLVHPSPAEPAARGRQAPGPGALLRCVLFSLLCPVLSVGHGRVDIADVASLPFNHWSPPSFPLLILLTTLTRHKHPHTQAEVVEVTARASWRAWAASSFGAALEDASGLALPSDTTTSTKPPGTSPFKGRDGAEPSVAQGAAASAAAAVGRAMGVRLAATGFFDPRGVGIPAEIGAWFVLIFGSLLGGCCWWVNGRGVVLSCRRVGRRPRI